MGAQEFFELVLPFQGIKVIALAVPNGNGGVWFKYKSYPTAEAAARAALVFDERGDTVYFAVNAFGDWYHDPDKNKRRIRTQENVVACRALFDDFDVDPEKNRKAGEEGKPEPCYDTREEAFADLEKLAKALGLSPTIVSSGGGYHAYYHLEEDIDPLEWEDLSSMKRDICNHLGIRYDAAVDMDSSRVLRPIGVHNRKYDPPRKVEMLKEGKTYSVEKVRSALQSYIRVNNVSPAPAARKKGPASANPFAAALGEFPPADADKVAEHCAAVRQFRDTGGDIPEPHWHRAIGIVKFCEGGEDTVHDWSKGYEGYTFEETQAKIDEWTVGPTSCAEMDRHIGCMADCPMAGKCKFPIQLGFTEDAPSVETETVVADAQQSYNTTSTTPAANPPTGVGATIEGKVIPYWPQSGYRWNGTTLARAYVDEDNVVYWRPFCKDFIYPINRVQDSEGTWVIHWRAKEKNGSWREFFMPTAELASTDMMAKTLAAHEVFLTRTKHARNDMAEFAETLIKTLQEWCVETKTYKQFGWTKDRTGFVLGNKMITLKGEEEVLCDDGIPGDIARDFGVSGTVDEWVASIDKIYNRPGAEPFQFAICHSMGSALVELMGSSNWHGLPLAFTGHGGTGKTTATKIACGFYGKPDFMNRQTGEQGSTLNAVIKRIAVTGAVPMLLDEFSGRTPEELTRTAYALANGRDKERLGSNGKFATTGDEWFKNSFITSNDRLAETISKLPAGYRVEATQLRFFEVSLPEGFSDKLFPDITQAEVEHHMDNLCGAACRPYIRFIIKNMDWVRRQLVAARSKVNPKDAEDNKERFYRDAIVTALMAGKIAEKIGLVSFDMKALKQWALDEVLAMRESRRENNMNTGEMLAQFIASLHGRLIITKHFGDGRSGRKELPMEPLRAAAVGRVCTEDKKVYITHKAVSDWCKENGIAQSELRAEMDRTGYLIMNPDGKPGHKVRIGSGTTVPSGPSTCYEINYRKLFDGNALTLV
ncbi:DUF927 domain-containing protein [Flavimaricola sp.]|nr:DUF927 domain-containing protein [Flavimaricola sp.]MDA9020236.1 DUF927 domain-containing protein [Flavimaricola sp.]